MGDAPVNHDGEDDLDRRIAEAQARHAPPSHNGKREESRGWAMGIDFVGAVVVSCFIGWAIDRWAGTAPWAMIAFLILGFCAGVWTVMKAQKKLNAGANGPDGPDGNG